eukprot:CAMPEP_0202906198 /NCGR_PEP_ID=MMETSP1392-20130828/37749_1 /ASSEMBLY_ACC=CAM_ASM_000868 /TAXON_ID=225041 /ORGANISM="Chlamydomonas chlamydogama, Strain SAG 11-48b" /LENGTH=488 /DNA_ID=CAMNT_0049594589 /DNA_START=295 /DNA_END=1761 /DNA_ORIENTATION=+
MGSGGKLTIAIEGCCHGELDNIYGTLQHLEKVEGKKIDLLISCGDFQAVRNMDDLQTMACPPKYRSINTFYKYYSGEKVAPYPTLFVGGNHEAANHLWELYHGGWAAPNIYFLGFTGCVRFGGVRIAGMSGIYSHGDYFKGHHEALPYNDSTIRSIYHTRDFEVYRLMQIKQPVDVFLSHDWPRNIASYGDTAALLSRKKFLRADMESGKLGSPAAEQLLHTLQPSYWFSAHLHTKFPALVQHPGGASTRFLALDKCLPGRDFLQVLELDASGPLQFEYDEEWLAIMRSTHQHINLAYKHKALPGMGGLRSGAKPEDLDFVRAALQAKGDASIPLNFTQTAPPYEAPASGHPGFKVPHQRGRMPQQPVRNPQTQQLLDMLGLPYNLDHSAVAQEGPGPGQYQGRGFAGQQEQLLSRGAGRGAPPLPPPPPRAISAAAAAAAMQNPEEIDLGDLDEEDEEDGQEQAAQCPVARSDAGSALSNDPMFQPL